MLRYEPPARCTRRTRCARIVAALLAAGALSAAWSAPEASAPALPASAVVRVVAASAPPGALVFVPAPASAAVKAVDTVSPLPKLLVELGALVATPFLAAVLGALGWLAARFYDQRSAVWAVKRSFAEATTKRVVELSNQHYWALANAAGTFSAELRNYLRMLEVHLFVHFAGDRISGETAARDLQARMREIAKESSQTAFPALVRLIHQFDLFQFRGSQTYLLPHEERGREMRRLYNMMATNLPEGGFLADVRRAVEKHLTTEPKTKADAQPPGIGGTFLEHHDLAPWLNLEPMRKRFVDWLLDALPAVSEAEWAAMAFERVMHAELEGMTEPFFKHFDRTRRDIGYRAECAIARSAVLGFSFSPLGGSAPVREHDPGGDGAPGSGDAFDDKPIPAPPRPSSEKTGQHA